jgi:ferric-dicitrate binding protein FerR (iron transport regulator)
MARHSTVAVAVIFASAMLLLLRGGAVDAQLASAGIARNAIGTLVVVRPDGVEDRLRGKGAVKLFEEDILRTEPGSQAFIELPEKISLAMNENTQLKLLSRWEKGKPLTRIVRLRQGEAWVKTGEGPKAFELETPVAAAIVKEGEFNMRVEPNGESILTVIQGIVEFGTAFGTCPIRPSTVSYGMRGKRCTRPETIDPTGVLRWSRQIVQ